MPFLDFFTEVSMVLPGTGSNGLGLAGAVLMCAMALATSDSANLRKLNSTFGSRNIPFTPPMFSDVI
jgi:hypothetical protein